MSEYSEDFLCDSIEIKEESHTMDNSLNISASVPIPGRRADRQSDTSLGRDVQFPSNLVQCALYPDFNNSEQLPPLFEPILNNTMWGTTKQESMNTDEDDFLKVDKADLIQGPTLAELNANDDTLLGDLNFDDLLLPEEGHTYSPLTLQPSPLQKLPFLQLSNNINNNCLLASSCPSTGLGYYRDSMEYAISPSETTFAFTSKTPVPTFSPTNQSNASLIRQKAPATYSNVNTTPTKHSTLHELLLKQDNNTPPEYTTLNQSSNTPTSPTIHSPLGRISRLNSSRLSTSAPTHLGLEQIWQRREPRKHLLSTGSLAEAGSTSSLSTGEVLSPEAQDLSHDDQDYDEDSEHYEDFSSDDGDSDDDDDHHAKALKREKYFWQYNVQAKGPKGQRLVLKTKMENPHVLNEVTDPVFSTECAVRGIKHSGKARKGDGNDLTPNPRKLFTIGKELDKLSRIINDMTPVSELPFNVRPKSRKEKNKLASRACRLKKKAQHEANKIKLHGLETEHRRVMAGISQVKAMLSSKLKANSEINGQLGNNLDKVAKMTSKTKIAGQTTEYVNKVLDKVKSGVPSGGLEDV